MKTAKTNNNNVSANNNNEEIDFITLCDAKRAGSVLLMASRQAVRIGYDRVQHLIVTTAKKIHVLLGAAWAKTSNPDGMIRKAMALVKDSVVGVCAHVWNAFKVFFTALFTKQVAA